MLKRSVVFLLLALSLPTSFGQNQPNLPVRPRPDTPQEILLLFSGNTADERILLTLNNNRPATLTTALTVYTASGISTILNPMDLVANESKLVELSPLLLAAGLGRQELGWLKVDYSGGVMEVGAQLTLYPGDGTVGVDSPRSLSLDFKSTARDAVFWMPRAGKARLSLTNNSGGSIYVKLNCDLLKDEFVIAARTTTTRKLQLPDLGPFGDSGEPLSCEMVSNGAIDALRPVGTVVAPGYSAPIRFYDPASATFSSLTSVGLETSAQTFVTVHNVTDGPVVFTPILREAALISPFTQALPERVLPPHGSATVDVTNLLSNLSAQKKARATLTLKSDAAKGAFVGAVTQIGSSDHLIEDIPLKTSNPPAFARGSYPLRWDQDYTNLVTVTNTAEKTLRIGGSITAGEMVYVFKREDIEPGSTIILDVDKWRKDQVPDVNGKTLPLNAPYGKIHWIEMGLGKNAGLLGRTSLASVQNHRRSSFSCGSSCVFDADGYPYFDSSPFTTLLIEDSLTTNASEHYSSQNGSSYTYPYNFSPDSMRVATSGVMAFSNGSQNTQLIETGVGYGTTNLDYDFTFNNPTYDPDEQVCDDNYETEDMEGSSEVPPTVNILSADLVSDAISVQLQAPANMSGPLSVTFSGPNAFAQPQSGGSYVSGTYNFSFRQDTLGSFTGEYTTVNAAWTLNGQNYTATYPYHFSVLGIYQQTQYNTPAENQCSGTPQAITVWNSSCRGTSASVISGFDFRVTDPATGTGSGHSMNFGDVQAEATCSVGRGDLRGFATITGSIGSGALNNSTVAVCRTSSIAQAGVNLYIRGEGVKQVTDKCAACCTGNAQHLDNYTTDTRCSVSVAAWPSRLRTAFVCTLFV